MKKELVQRREKEIELITLSLMRDDVGSLFGERNEVNDS
jgi:hypothetical protein